MTLYTIHNDTKVDLRIEQDLQQIVAELCDTISDVHAVILAGGFGRGEGTVVFSNGTPRPVNDYDLVVVTKQSHRERKRLDSLGQSMAEALGIDFVDFALIALDNLRKLSPTIFNFELKHGSRVVFGPESVLDLIPNYQANEIPPREGMILLMNRMGDILGRHHPFIKVKELTSRQLEFISIPLHKALLACGDSLLMMHDLYHASYRKRLATLEKLKREGQLSFISSRDLDLMRFAFEQKLAPEQFIFDDPPELLRELLSLYREVFLRFASHALNVECSTVSQAVRYFMRSERIVRITTHQGALLRFLVSTHPRQWRLLFDVAYLSRESIIYATLPALFFSGPWGGTDSVLLALALDLIHLLQGRRLEGHSELTRWNAARETGFGLWKALFH